MELRGEAPCRIFVMRYSEKRLLLLRSRRWWDKIKMDVKGIGFGEADWIHVAEDALKWWALADIIQCVPKVAVHL
jgi:hypothetical protein